MAAAVLIVATVVGLAWRRWNGRLKAAPGTGSQVRLTPQALGHPLAARATLLQFSSAACAPCRTAARILAGVAARSPGVTHIELDAADRLDLVRLLDIRRVPTVLVLGPGGQVASRASGVPRPGEIAAAVAAVDGPERHELGKSTQTRGSDSGHGHA